MLNLRIGVIIAGTAFFLSLFLGLAGGTTLPLLIVRPVIFAGIFFIFPSLIKMVISRFLPELLEEGGSKREAENLSGSEGESQPWRVPAAGSRINILEGDPGSTGPAPKQAVFGALPDDSDEELGNISELHAVSTASRTSYERTQEGMDQNPQEDYTGEGAPDIASKEAPEGKPEKQARGTGFGDISSEDALPDLDSMAGAFLSPVKGEESVEPEYSAPLPKPSLSSKNKAPAWSGDFNAKELASGLRTILSKEKEG